MIAIFLVILSVLGSIVAALYLGRKNIQAIETQIQPTAQDYTPKPVPPLPMPPQPNPTPDPDALLPWIFGESLTHNNWHNVRALCDLEGLSHEQKEILTACVWQESWFNTNPKPNQNKDPKTGEVWSTDFGIVQVNDYYNIGPGKPFPSVEYVLNNPEACVRWMAKIYKTTGRLQPWASWTSGAYKKYLGRTL